MLVKQFNFFQVESPPNDLDAQAQKLPDIQECPTPNEMTSQTRLQTPSTPRIDISRASSSSHHDDSAGAGGSDSRDSTPERELFGPQCSRLGPAFREDGALDLRSSTEELDFQDPNDPMPIRKPEQPGRKDSQGSELAFLSVSGRTSRLSSIGSQGSRASGASRSPSPHKMLLETSFCGPKGGPEAPGAPPLEHALLSRQLDPSEAVLAEGISIEMRKKIANSPSPNNNRNKNQPPQIIPIVKIEAQVENTDRQTPPPIPPGATIVAESGVEYTFIPLRGPLPTQQTKVKILTKAQTKPQVIKKPNAFNTPKQPARKLMPSGAEYIRIKLKPDHMYEGDETEDEEAPPKPDSLTLNNGTVSDGPNVIKKTEPPKPHIPTNSRTPSPSVSRKSSFTSLFRNRESATSSPESPAPRGKSKSVTTTSVLGSIFKPKKSCIKRQTSPEDTPKSAPVHRPPNLEFTFGGASASNGKPKLKYYETPLEGNSIRIPLHSPGTEPEPLELLSPDVPPKEPDKEVVTSPPSVPNPRHSSTSSDNIVFTTNLGK